MACHADVGQMPVHPWSGQHEDAIEGGSLRFVNSRGITVLDRPVVAEGCLDVMKNRPNQELFIWKVVIQAPRVTPAWATTSCVPVA